MGISPVAQSCQLSDIAVCALRSGLKVSRYIAAEGAVRPCDAVALFRDGKTYHLKAVCGKDLLKAVPVLSVMAVYGKRFSKASDHGLFNGAVCF